MICPKCRDQKHGNCKGGTWCDCQHAQNITPTDTILPGKPTELK